MNIGFIYNIYDNTNGSVYYGSTTETFSRRLSKHKSAYKQWCKGTGSQTKSVEIIKNDDFTISLVEQVEYQEKAELHRRERYYIENDECVNKYIPTRSQKEYKYANKESIKVYKKGYYVSNREHLNEKQKEYENENREHINEMKRNRYHAKRPPIDPHASWRKEYYEDNGEVKAKYADYSIQNADEIKELIKIQVERAYGRAYYLKNKESIKAKKEMASVEFV
jgi:hypothetical protein